MSDCEFLAKCPVWAKFSTDTIKAIWIKNYCQGDKQDRCERKRRAAAGEPVPENLLPNGTTHSE